MRARIVENNQLKILSDLDAICTAIASGQPIWIDLEEQCAEADELLVKTLNIHPLTIEDIWATRSAPKLEDYRDYLYMIIHAIRGQKKVGFDLIEVDVVIGKNFIITHDRDGEITKEVVGELERDPSRLAKGPAWVAHMVLDHAVDRYLPVVDELDVSIEALTNDALTRAGTPKGPPVLRRILRYK